MKTVVDNMRDLGDQVRLKLESLLLEHSSLHQWNRNNDGIVFISVYGDCFYGELGVSGRRRQASLLEEYRLFHALFETLLRHQPEDVLKRFSDSHTTILRTIEQQQTWCRTTEEANLRASDAIVAQQELLEYLYDPAEGAMIYVPDTNALLYNPQIEKWEFEEGDKFVVALAPTVVSELDSLKINHRNEEVRKKSESIIRRLKELRRRGRLSEGVTLVSNKSDIMAISVEPDIGLSLPWLDPSNNDDRFLASVIELMRSRPRSIVIAVSRDLNLQNKAEFARVPFVEPPEPVSE
jgi:hypothetical protein